MAGLGRTWRRHRAAVAANLALVLAVSGVVYYAVSADGLQDPPGRAQRRRDLGDQPAGRLLRPGQQADRPVRRCGLRRRRRRPGHRPAGRGRGRAWTCRAGGWRRSTRPRWPSPTGRRRPCRPRPRCSSRVGRWPSWTHATARCGRPASTRQRAHPRCPRWTPRRRLSPSREPTSALAVTQAGTVLAVSADEDSLTRLEPVADGFSAPARTQLDVPVADGASLTAVGQVPVTLDPAAGSLVAVGAARAVVGRAPCSSSRGPPPARSSWPRPRRW